MHPCASPELRSGWRVTSKRFVIPAKAGIQCLWLRVPLEERHWTNRFAPFALLRHFAGVTRIESTVWPLLTPPMAGKGLQPISRKHSGQ